MTKLWGHGGIVFGADAGLHMRSGRVPAASGSRILDGLSPAGGAGLGPEMGWLGVAAEDDGASRGYSLVATVLNVVLRLVPTFPKAETAPSAISVAIKPYSMAVAPTLFCQRARKRRRIFIKP